MNTISNDEINLIDVLKKIYISRKFIFSVTSAFFVISLVISLILPFKYTSSTIFIPQSQESNSSSLSGVASLVGISLGNQSYGNEIPVTMYPLIFESTKFKRALLNEIIDKESKLTLKESLTDYYNIKNDDNILKNNETLITKSESDLFDLLSGIISVNVDEKDGFVVISSTMHDPKQSANLTIITREILQKLIIENKIEGAKKNLEFSQSQLKQKKNEFNNIQSKLSYFKDTNLNLVTSSIIDEQTKLQSDFEIINAVVIELSKQVEQAKIQVKKDTPLFSTIKEAVVPIKKSSPKRAKIVIYFTVIGMFLSTSIILIKDKLIYYFRIIIN